MIDSKRYLNDVLMQRAVSRSPVAPAVINPNKLAAAHAVQQQQTRNDVLNAGRSLGLRERELGLSRQRLGFDQQRNADTLRLAREDFNTSKSLTNQANLIHGLGLGVNAWGSYKTMKNTDETMRVLDNYINSRNDMNDQAKNFFKVLIQKRMAFR